MRENKKRQAKTAKKAKHPAFRTVAFQTPPCIVELGMVVSLQAIFATELLLDIVATAY